MKRRFLENHLDGTMRVLPVQTNSIQNIWTEMHLR